MTNKYDIAIIGAGPGGYVAAIRAAQLGAHVALIEKDKVGGTCLNRGCIPTKALLACVSLYNQFQKSENFGITAQNISIDLKKVVDRKNKIIDKLVKGVEFLLEKNKIELIRGEGEIIEPGKIEIKKAESGKQATESRKIILATGSSPACLPGISFDGKCFLSSDDILNLTEVPKKLDIVGGGVIGIHFAYMFASLGSEVTVYEALPEILGGVDEEIVSLAKRILSRKIKFITNTKFIKDSSCGKTLICVGRKPNGEKIQVNEKMETDQKDVYAIGDLVSSKQFAHVASEQGIIAAENAMGEDRTFDYSCVPYTIYTQPEIASVGLTEQDTRASEYQNIRIGKFSFGALGISQAMGEIEGFVKVISDKSGKILGVHIIGPEANTIIGAATVAVKNKLTVNQLADTIQAHPSFPEGLEEAALAALKRSLHSIN